MNFLINGKQIRLLDGYFYCDGDFLGLLLNDENFLLEVKELFSGKTFLIDSLTRLEFLRDVYLPKQRKIKEEFLDSIFDEAIDHQEIYRQIKDNALILSRLYAHKGRNGASTVDLMLAARIMLGGYPSFLITGNRKHFPSIIFDTMSVINYEQRDGEMRIFSVLKFSKDKFQKALDDLKQIK